MLWKTSRKMNRYNSIDLEIDLSKQEMPYIRVRDINRKYRVRDFNRKYRVRDFNRKDRHLKNHCLKKNLDGSVI